MLFAVGSDRIASGVMFVAVLLGGSGHAEAVGASDPLRNWEILRSVPSGPLRKVAYGNDVYVATTTTGDVYRSTDGTHWTAQPFSGGRLSGVEFLDGQFVAFGENVSVSRDGRDWLTRGGPTNNLILNDLCLGPEFYVGVGSGGATFSRPFGTCAIVTSRDLVAWSEPVVPLPSPVQLNAITYGNGRFVVVGRNSNAAFREDLPAPVLVSTDGTNWLTHTVAKPGPFGTTNYLATRLDDVAYADGLYVAVGSKSARRTNSLWQWRVCLGVQSGRVVGPFDRRPELACRQAPVGPATASALWRGARSGSWQQCVRRHD